MVMIGSLCLRAKASRSGTRAIVPSFLGDLADHPGRRQAGDAGQIDGRLGVGRADQRAAVAGPQRDDVALA
jgi:hypothetical protein